MEERIQEVRQTLCDPDFLRQVGAAWKLLFFMMLQVDFTSKSYSAKPDDLAAALGVTVGTLSSWMERLQTLKIIQVKTSGDKVKVGFLPPLSQITLVTEEGLGTDALATAKQAQEFDESTTDIILRKRTNALHRFEEDIDFIFNKLQSIDLRLGALEGSFVQHHQSKNK